MYTDSFAIKLSEGNHHKLLLRWFVTHSSFVTLIDELSTGLDPMMKRDMLQTLHKVSESKAVTITTRTF